MSKNDDSVGVRECFNFEEASLVFKHPYVMMDASPLAPNEGGLCRMYVRFKASDCSLDFTGCEGIDADTELFIPVWMGETMCPQTLKSIADDCVELEMDNEQGA